MSQQSGKLRRRAEEPDRQTAFVRYLCDDVPPFGRGPRGKPDHLIERQSHSRTAVRRRDEHPKWIRRRDETAAGLLGTVHSVYDLLAGYLGTASAAITAEQPAAAVSAIGNAVTASAALAALIAALLASDAVQGDPDTKTLVEGAQTDIGTLDTDIGTLSTDTADAAPSAVFASITRIPGE